MVADTWGEAIADGILVGRAGVAANGKAVIGVSEQEQPAGLLARRALVPIQWRRVTR